MKFTEAVGKFSIGAFMLTFNVIFGGWVFSKLWVWLVVPIYGVEPLSVAQAIAMVFIVNYLLAYSKGKNDRKLSDLFLQSVFNKLFGLGLGYLFSQFI